MHRTGHRKYGLRFPPALFFSRRRSVTNPPVSFILSPFIAIPFTLNPRAAGAGRAVSINSPAIRIPGALCNEQPRVRPERAALMALN